MAKQNKVTHELKYKNKSIINKDSSQDAKATFSNSDNWKNYARYIGRNRFFRNYLFHTYNERCQFCGKKLNPDTFVLHHKTYLHECMEGYSAGKFPSASQYFSFSSFTYTSVSLLFFGV